jgi:hypothetical protein
MKKRTALNVKGSRKDRAFWTMTKVTPQMNTTNNNEKSAVLFMFFLSPIQANGPSRQLIRGLIFDIWNPFHEK